jgi:hypothetical protein
MQSQEKLVSEGVAAEMASTPRRMSAPVAAVGSEADGGGGVDLGLAGQQLAGGSISRSVSDADVDVKPNKRRSQRESTSDQASMRAPGPGSMILTSLSTHNIEFPGLESGVIEVREMQPAIASSLCNPVAARADLPAVVTRPRHCE